MAPWTFSELEYFPCAGLLQSTMLWSMIATVPSWGCMQEKWLRGKDITWLIIHCSPPDVQFPIWQLCYTTHAFSKQLPCGELVLIFVCSSLWVKHRLARVKIAKWRHKKATANVSSGIWTTWRNFMLCKHQKGQIQLQELIKGCGKVYNNKDRGKR